MLEPARYTVTADTAFINSCQYLHGAEVRMDGWPRGDLAPLNAAAERIHAYWVQRNAWPFFPTSPVHGGHGIYLPYELPRLGTPSKTYIGDADGSELMTPPAEVTEGMPLYQTRLAQVGNRQITEGETFAYLAWPDPRLEPANDVAQAVVDYLAAHRDHPDRLPSPWCCYRLEVYLPPLAKLEHRGRHSPQLLSPPTPIPIAHRSGSTNSTHGVATPTFKSEHRRRK